MPAELAAAETNSSLAPGTDLTNLLLGSGAVSASTAGRLTAQNSWEPLFLVASAWSVIPNLRNRVAELGLLLPPAAKKRLFHLFQDVYVASTLQARRGVAVCRKLEDSGIPAVIFKGLASIAHLYQGNPATRTIKDVDILIREQDLHAALAVIESLGLQLDHGGDLLSYADFVRNSPGFAGNEALSARGDGLGELDVHWSLGPRTSAEFRVDAIMQRAVWAGLFGQQVRVVSAADGLLLSAHHAVRENFAPDGMIRDVVDAASWLNLLQQNGEREISLARARRCHIEDPVLALAEIAGRQVNLPCPSTLRASKLAQLFWLQANHGPLGKDFLYLADFHSLKQIFRGVLSGWAEYSSHMKALETKLNGGPISIGARVGDLAREVRQQGFRRWRMLRVLAKTKAAYQRGS